MRQGLGAGALAAIMVAIVSFAVGASPLMKSSSPSESISSRISLFRQVLLYAKEGSRKLVDGRWNLGQSESKLGIKLSADETKQLMACTGNIVCVTPGGKDEDGDEVEDKVLVTATAVSVLRPDLLVTAKHVRSRQIGQKSATQPRRRRVTLVPWIMSIGRFSWAARGARGEAGARRIEREA